MAAVVVGTVGEEVYEELVGAGHDQLLLAMSLLTFLLSFRSSFLSPTPFILTVCS